MSEPRRKCWCVINHPQTPGEREELKASLAWARTIRDHHAVTLCLLMLIGPCPAWPTPRTVKEKNVDEVLRALAGGANHEVIDRETLRMHVARQVTCPVTRTVLDLKRAVLVQGDGQVLGVSVISAQAWDELGTTLLNQFAELGAMPKIVDARLLDWSTRPMDYEELGVYRDVLNRFAGDEAFARWCANRYPWGAFDLGHERRTYEMLRRFEDGDAVVMRFPWEDLPKGTTGRTVGRPYELYRQPISPVQFIELPDRRRVVVPLGHLDPKHPTPAAIDAADKEDESNG